MVEETKERWSGDIPLGIPVSIRTMRHLGMALVLVGSIVWPVLSQASSTASATATVRVLPRAAAGYDPSAEVLLRGVAGGWEGGQLLLRLNAGTVRVDTGSWDGREALAVGAPVEVLASKVQQDGRQRFLARQIRHARGLSVVRDAWGVPISAAIPGAP